MPITVGSQSNVPATGDPIVSPWYQDTATKLVHRFANQAARDAWTTRPEGAVAYLADADATYQWTGAAWVLLPNRTFTDNSYVNVGGDAMSGDLVVGGNPSTPVVGSKLQTNGSILSCTGDATASLNLRRTGTAPAGEKFATMARLSAGAEIGSISIASVSAVAFNTTSDPRVKSAPPATRGIDDAADRARLLGENAWRGQWIDPETGEPSGETWDFLSSHDIEDVAGYAVLGERDAVDDDGNPVYQQVNYPALVPLLFAALADAFDRIAALEAAD